MSRKNYSGFSRFAVAFPEALWYLFELPKGGVIVSDKILKELYDCFYTEPDMSVQKQVVEENHKALVEVLEKPQRRQVLNIIDAKDRMCEVMSIDSFIAGFELAWQISVELSQQETRRAALYKTVQEQRAYLMLKKKEASES